MALARGSGRKAQHWLPREENTQDKSHPVVYTPRGFVRSIRAPEPTIRSLCRPLGRPAASVAHRHRYWRVPRLPPLFELGVDRENARGNMTLVSVRPPPVAIGGAAPPDRAPRPRTSTRRLGAREQLAHSVDTALCSQAAASLAAHRRTRVPVWWRVRTLRKGSARACPPCRACAVLDSAPAISRC